MLVYAIISPFGISWPFITPSGLAINGENYTDICLAKKSVPNIRNLPEKTVIYYSARLFGGSLLEKSRPILVLQNFKFVLKSENSIITPEIRWIEDIWILIKEEVYKDKWKFGSAVNELEYFIVSKKLIKNAYSN